MTKQTAKYHINVPGECHVAAEQQRHDAHAFVTYGNARGTVECVE